MAVAKKKDRDRHSRYFTVRFKKSELRELKAAAKSRFEGNISREIRERCFPGRETA